MSTDTHGTVITIRDVYDAQKQTDGKVEAVSVQVASFTSEVKVRLDYNHSQLAEQEARIRVLEQFRWKLLGGAGLIGAVTGSGAAAIVVAILTHH